MSPITRRSFFARAGAIPALAGFPDLAAEDNTQEPEWPTGEVENGAFRLSLSSLEALDILAWSTYPADWFWRMQTTVTRSSVRSSGRTGLVSLMTAPSPSTLKG